MQIIPVATIIKTTVTTAKQRGVVNTSSSEMPAGTNVKSARTQAKKKERQQERQSPLLLLLFRLGALLKAQRPKPKKKERQQERVVVSSRSFIFFIIIFLQVYYNVCTKRSFHHQIRTQPLSIEQKGRSAPHQIRTQQLSIG
jgi:hypothetical protein